MKCSIIIHDYYLLLLIIPVDLCIGLLYNILKKCYFHFFLYGYRKEWDIIIFSQSWPYTFCHTWTLNSSSHTCNLPANRNQWTIHGIWCVVHHYINTEQTYIFF